MTDLFEITPDQEDQVRSWYKEGRGCYRWRSRDLSSRRPDVITPGDTDKAPHWAYVGKPISITPDQIVVNKRTAVSLVPEWFPKCDTCKGRGHRTLQEIHALRKEETIAELRKSLNDGGRMEWLDEEQTTFKCWSCHGSAHDIKQPTARWINRPTWRSSVSDTGILKFNKIAEKLAKHYGLSSLVLWDAVHLGYGLVEAHFYTEEKSPFVV